MRLRTLCRTGLSTAMAAVVGGVASGDVKTRWYERLDKPAIQPPAVVFPVMWTVLYTDIALSSAVTIDRLNADGSAAARAYERALALNLVLNASWTWVFFRAHRLSAATAVAGALTVSSADLARRAAAAGRPLSLALAPYVAWCGFATVLSGAISHRNGG